MTSQRLVAAKLHQRLLVLGVLKVGAKKPEIMPRKIHLIEFAANLTSVHNTFKKACFTEPPRDHGKWKIKVFILFGLLRGYLKVPECVFIMFRALRPPPRGFQMQENPMGNCDFYYVQDVKTAPQGLPEYKKI